MTGRAVLVTIDIDNPAAAGAMWEGPFEERDTDAHHEHPIARAYALWESIKDDWPTHSATVISNPRAGRLQAAYRMEQLGFDYDEALAKYEADEAPE